jgi:hypothetical protein
MIGSSSGKWCFPHHVIKNAQYPAILRNAEIVDTVTTKTAFVPGFIEERKD